MTPARRSFAKPLPRLLPAFGMLYINLGLPNVFCSIDPSDRLLVELLETSPIGIAEDNTNGTECPQR
jgi:hypothetical protein